MGLHDKYGKTVLEEACGSVFIDKGPSVEINLSAGRPARIDGVIGNNIAVEIESRVPKQVRGAIMDLIVHDCPKKLLVLLPVHMNNIHITAKQSNYILSRFLKEDQFKVVSLTGDGKHPNFEQDVKLIRDCIESLGND